MKATNKDISSIIGLPENEAITAIKAMGYSSRIIEREGSSCTITQDIRGDRINLYIAGGKVYKTRVG